MPACRDFPDQPCVIVSQCIGRHSYLLREVGVCWRTEQARGHAMGIDAIMATMPERHRQRWCDNKGGCGCMGCANRIHAYGFTKEDWQDWINRNPAVASAP